MDIYQSFENAIKLEKVSGYGFAFLGVILLLISGYFFFLADKNGFLVSAKFPSLIAGIFLLVSSPIFVTTIDKKVKTQTEIYNKDKSVFVKSEIERNEKLFNGYKNYRLVFALVAIVALLVTAYFRQSLVGGIAFVVFIFSSYSAISEHISYIKGGQYLTELREWKFD